MARHVKWIARTVIAKVDQENKISAWEEAYEQLNRQLRKENILQTTKRNRYYEKPWMRRRRLAYEKPWMRRRRLAYEECKKIYNDEMEQKVSFLLRKNRREPWRI
ncbi:small ribosomal subunit protein bS21m-like [Ciona intestinalis]